MLPYFVLFGFLAVMFLADKYDDRFKPFVFWISGLALVIFSGTRIGMGRDYKIYEYAYQFPDSKTAHNFELIWQWINKAFHSLNLDFHTWLFCRNTLHLLFQRLSLLFLRCGMALAYDFCNFLLPFLR